MAAGCAVLLSPLSPLCLQPLNPALSARVLHALASLLTGSLEGSRLFREHHPSQAWRKRSPLHHPWRKGNTAASLEEGEPFAASLAPTTFAEARSPPPGTGGSRGYFSALPRLSPPSSEDEDVAESNLTFTETGKPSVQNPSAREGFWLRGG